MESEGGLDLGPVREEEREEKFHSVCKPKLSFLDSVELRNASLCGNRSLKKKIKNIYEGKSGRQRKSRVESRRDCLNS